MGIDCSCPASLHSFRIPYNAPTAGGHFALWVAGRHNLLISSILYKKNPLTVQGVIGLGGVPDLLAFREQAKKICESGDIIGELVGKGTVESYTKNFKEASPSELLPLGTKQILIYGEDEASVPVKFGDDYKKTASSKGDSVTVITVKGAGHHEYNVPNSVTWPVILTNVKELLK